MSEIGRYARVSALVAAAVVGMTVATGCSGDSGVEAPTTRETSSQETSTPGSAGPQEQTDLEGEEVSLSVASFTLPAPGPWVSGGVNGDASGDITGYKITDETSGVEVCTVVLTVVSDADVTPDTIRDDTTALSGDRATFEDDADAPDGVTGLISRVDRSEDPASPFISVHRSWFTAGNTYISLAVTARGVAPDPRCDAELIASSLQWSGEERPVGEVSS